MPRAEEPAPAPDRYRTDDPKSVSLSGGKMLDVVHYFLVDEGKKLAALALSAAWCGASLKLLFSAGDEPAPN